MVLWLFGGCLSSWVLESKGVFIRLAKAGVSFCFGVVMEDSHVHFKCGLDCYFQNIWPDSDVITRNPCPNALSELCSSGEGTVVEMMWKGAHRGVSSFFLPSSSRSVPNRYTFPCPYCPEKNFDQEGLVEHCKLSHSTDTKSVVRETEFFCFVGFVV